MNFIEGAYDIGSVRPRGEIHEVGCDLTKEMQGR